MQALDPGTQELVFGLLDGVDDLHRAALRALEDELDETQVRRLRGAHPAISWLFDAYAVGYDQRAAAEEALEAVRPYVESHGGRVEVVDVTNGVVTVRLAGACAGCTASAITLQEGVIAALSEGFPGFARMEVIEDPDAAPHPPPGPTLHQISRSAPEPRDRPGRPS